VAGVVPEEGVVVAGVVEEAHPAGGPEAGEICGGGGGFASSHGVTAAGAGAGGAGAGGVGFGGVGGGGVGVAGAGSFELVVKGLGGAFFGGDVGVGVGAGRADVRADGLR